MSGSLLIVGTGIQLARHVTYEARLAIERSQKVLFLVPDGATELWLKDLNPTAESLFSCYVEGEDFMKAYKTMVERILHYVRRGLSVCVALYGHPGVFVNPSHEAIKQARSEGYCAKMLPGISAEDCLFADLGLDPSDFGCQSLEATDFLIHAKKLDTTRSLILWDIGFISDGKYRRKGWGRKGFDILVKVLIDYYSLEHEVVLYEASTLAVFEPIIKKSTLGKINEVQFSPMSTLYVPPISEKIVDSTIMEQLTDRSKRDPSQ
jgi:uncharacterized protein YabN with tetrapyrrole methylase and pyrophosphatase domain